MKKFVEMVGYVINRAPRHLFSFYRWVFFVRPLTSEEVMPVQREAMQSVSFRLATDDDYQGVITAYPPELGRHLPEHRKRRELEDRRSAGERCFVAVDEHGTILGATWCRRSSHSLLERMPVVGEQPVFEMTNTFVVAECRGRGVGRALRRYALRSMREAGFGAVVSFVWYSRRASLAMNFATGSRIVGEKTQLSLLGWRQQRFGTSIRVDKLPLGELPVLRLTGGHRADRRILKKWCRHSGVPVVLASPGWDCESGCSGTERVLDLDQSSDGMKLGKAGGTQVKPSAPDLKAASKAANVSFLVTNGVDATGPGLVFRNHGIHGGSWQLEPCKGMLPPEWVYDAAKNRGNGVAVVAHGTDQNQPCVLVTAAFSLPRLADQLESYGIGICAAMYLQAIGWEDLIAFAAPDVKLLELDIGGKI